ncbi:cytochrome c, class I [Thiobacillus denitrificans ATCC 25259]|uniref:Cytochrome c, class I n=1 Tax=Thiobacillus denitrificans (strain ATCC 25259 / T1) TaxID=292415 RepID=Q3SKU6_THIDA|nr:FTR1 family protein [Thiobacillus denitrificans]AAZ96676.1 cytochrome c, class I [Thiobacillus denitrificans ATCC 25259]
MNQRTFQAAFHAVGWVAALLVLVALSLPARAASADPGRTAQTIAHMLDYVGVDYPEFVRDGKVLDAAEYQEQSEFSVQVIEQLRKLPDNPAKAGLLRQAETLNARIAARAPGDEVSRLAGELRQGVIAAYRIAVAPKRAPDLRGAARLYAAQCAACHGAEGKGDGVQAGGMEPAPADFHDAARMRQRSVYGLFSTISLGVSGTAMGGFDQLSEAERWALAFYVSSLGTPAEVAQQGAARFAAGGSDLPFANLKTLVMTTENEVRARDGDAAAAVFAWLRQNPVEAKATAEPPLAFAGRHVDESLAAYRSGDVALAQRLAVTGYLEGFELVEASLDASDRALRQEIETQMTAYRNLLRAGAPVADAEKQAALLHALLARAGDTLDAGGLSPFAALLGAFFILVREGLEALLVVAAVVAFLVKAERREALRYVHVGWIGALGLGVLTWFVASYVIAISGAGREVTEGITALAASAILLYVGFWLHDKSHADRWKAFVGRHLTHALSRGTLWALAGVSFLAVYREAFETVLFYQALWQQAEGARSSVLAGAGLGAATLAVLGWMIFRFGLRLPIGPFFAASSALLALLAVMFAGHGVAALQEAGWLPLDPVNFIEVPLLGIYANVQALSLQGGLIAVILVGFAWGHARRGLALASGDALR